MKNHEQIKQILSQMADVLQQCHLDEWAVRLGTFCTSLDTDPVATKSSILSLYGGMGSINDIVLYRNMQPLIAENQIFDQLREQLYSLVR